MSYVHQKWDLGSGNGALMLDLRYAEPLPAAAYDVLADLQRSLEDAAARLNRLLDGAS